ncbi:hypothetical protein [Phaeobacter sp. J2-8]|uniref:hypothetical protein n=1 Tax=Phaeobacter sp. J2-8 TaxID=2931394 RepID=UPI001FD58E9B|nr:hypothetical protein [Phaeobacter sp. J2-8]MCJ7872020.1 hypothetical protein [Phaeobacter sp. J2-8]
MTLQRVAGCAALICAASYLFGIAVLVLILAPLGFGSIDVDPHAVVAFIDTRPTLLITWNTVIYVVNAIALTVLVEAMHRRQSQDAPEWAAVSRAFGLIWAALVLGAGMIANVAIERAAHIFPVDPVRAAELWQILHTVELGLGGGNEIAGAVWVGLVSMTGLIGKNLGRVTIGLGLITGISGLATVIPALGDSAGAMFGIGAIAWFVAVGWSCFRRTE